MNPFSGLIYNKKYNHLDCTAFVCTTCPVTKYLELKGRNKIIKFVKDNPGIIPQPFDNPCEGADIVQVRCTTIYLYARIQKQKKIQEILK